MNKLHRRYRCILENCVHFHVSVIFYLRCQKKRACFDGRTAFSLSSSVRMTGDDSHAGPKAIKHHRYQHQLRNLVYIFEGDMFIWFLPLRIVTYFLILIICFPSMHVVSSWNYYLDWFRTEPFLLLLTAPDSSSQKRSKSPSMYLYVIVCSNSLCGCWIGSSNGLRRRLFDLELSNRRWLITHGPPPPPPISTNFREYRTWLWIFMRDVLVVSTDRICFQF